MSFDLQFRSSGTVRVWRSLCSRQELVRAKSKPTFPLMVRRLLASVYPMFKPKTLPPAAAAIVSDIRPWHTTLFHFKRFSPAVRGSQQLVWWLVLETLSPLSCSTRCWKNTQSVDQCLPKARFSASPLPLNVPLALWPLPRTNPNYLLHRHNSHPRSIVIFLPLARNKAPSTKK